ncbi:MAG: right-handed parallel beta-helix repeat-containing protein [Betaproteobacteria bacterium]|nr:right-handed parallel beta-helix repeat-containing protein [Betaproteobacteria bacterium]
MNSRFWLIAVLGGLAITQAWAVSRPSPRVLQVGPARTLQAPSQAARVARDGDTVEIDAGEYRGDAAIWRAHGLKIRSVGGMALLRAAGASAEQKAIWVIKGNDTTVDGIGFLDARVADRNGAGIRLEGRNLTVRNSLFRDNENGILTGQNPDSEVLVEHTEFDHNGYGDGQSHNLYVGAIRRFTLRFSYSHTARVGHQVKSRAAENHILYNRIADDAGGRSSYLIDLPAGGLSYVAGNVLHQGALAENYTMVSYGAEKLMHPVNRLYVLHNTFVNDREQGCRALFVASGAEKALMLNNLMVDCAKTDGPVLEGNTVTASRASLMNAAQGDLRPRPGSAAVDRGMSCAALERLDLSCPEMHYLHPLRFEPRRIQGAPDAGAYESPQGSAAPSPAPEGAKGNRGGPSFSRVSGR